MTIYIIDKNTRRVIHFVEKGQTYLLDEYTFAVEAEPFDFGNERLWFYKWDGTTFNKDVRNAPQRAARRNALGGIDPNARRVTRV